MLAAVSGGGAVAGVRGERDGAGLGSRTDGGRVARGCSRPYVGVVGAESCTIRRVWSPMRMRTAPEPMYAVPGLCRAVRRPGPGTRNVRGGAGAGDARGSRLLSGGRQRHGAWCTWRRAVQLRHHLPSAAAMVRRRGTGAFAAIGSGPHAWINPWGGPRSRASSEGARPADCVPGRGGSSPCPRPPPIPRRPHGTTAPPHPRR